jgi:hypothetical protein
MNTRLIKIGQQWARREVYLAQTDAVLKVNFWNRFKAITLAALILFLASLASASSLAR